MATIYEVIDYLIELYEETEENNRSFGAWYFAEARPCFATGELFKRKRPSYHHFNPTFFAVSNHLIECTCKNCFHAITWDDYLFHDEICTICYAKLLGAYDYKEAEFFGNCFKKYGTF